MLWYVMAISFELKHFFPKGRRKLLDSGRS